jgi:hypothetical protein
MGLFLCTGSHLLASEEPSKFKSVDDIYPCYFTRFEFATARDNKKRATQRKAGSLP